MRKFILLLTLAAVLLPASIFASIYGTLEGKVVDADGKGVVGASIFVEGTTRGTNVKASTGAFTITNITAGSYTVRVRAVGKTEYRTNVRISADQVTRINVNMRDDAVALEGVTVVADQGGPGKVNSEIIGSVNTLSNEQLTTTTSTSLAGVVGMSAGVSTGTDGYSIRGSRPSETQIRLDGLNMGNQFSGGFGASGSTYFPMVSTYATEEVQVITGNFAAQYGDAQGGIVNSVMKTGRTDRYEGFLAFRSELPFLSGSQANNSELIYENGVYKVIDGSGDGLSYLPTNAKNLNVGFGGALSFINDKSTFFVTVDNRWAPYSAAGYDRIDKGGYSTIRNDFDGVWSRNLEGRLAFGLTNDIRIVLGGKYGLFTNQSSGTFKYMQNEGTPRINPETGEIDVINGVPTANGVTQAEGKTMATNQYSNNVFARINHTLTDNSFYEFTVAWGENNSATSRKVSGSDNNYFTGYELMEPVDNWVVSGSSWLPQQYLNGRWQGDLAVDWAQSPSSIRWSNDQALYEMFESANPITGYYEGEAYNQGTQNPYGLNGFGYSGGASGFSFTYNNFLQASGNYNLFGVKTGEFTHTLKGGFEASYFTLNKHYNGNPHSTAPTYDIYTDMWGGNIYTQAQEIYDKTSSPMNLFKLGVYVQDQITYKGIVFNPGLRLDVMDPMNKYRILDPNAPNGLQFIPISSSTGFADASVKYQISPRLSMNYPITERSYIAMSYGQFFQSPMADYMFEYFNLENIVSSVAVGDPNMEAQQTNQYQVEYKNMLTDDVALGLTVYFKDIYNQLGILQVQTTPQSYLQWAVSEYGSSKGIELSIDKYLSDHFSLSLNYALAYIIVTATDPSSNSSVFQDPYSGEQTFPLAPYYSSNDIRHQIKGNIMFAMGQGEGPELLNMKPLQNMYVSFEPTVRSGLPYTRYNVDNTMQLSERNVYRTQFYWNVNARISKRFALKDWFGESMGNRSTIEFYADIQNMFNNRSAISVYTNTGDPLDDQTLNRIVEGSFSRTPWYKEASAANPQSYVREQYDNYGNRLYNEAADLDKNGIVTQAEKYQVYLDYYENEAIQARGNYQIPIRVSAGLAITF